LLKIPESMASFFQRMAIGHKAAKQGGLPDLAGEVFQFARVGACGEEGAGFWIAVGY
jgi:hypothetical protein